MNVKKILKFLIKILILFASIFVLTYGFLFLFSIVFYGKTYFYSDWENSNLVFLLGTCGQLLSVFLFLKFIIKKPLEYIFYKKDNLFKNIGQGLFWGFFQITVFVLIALAFNFIDFKSFDWNNFNFIFICYFIAFFIQSTSEEVLIRGLLTRFILEKFGKKAAIFVPAIVFGLMHLFNNSVTLISTLNTMLVGIFFALLLFYTKNIMFVSGVHAAWNFSMALIYGLPVSGFNGFNSLISFNILNSHIVDTNYGPEGSIIVTIIEIISIIIIMILGNRRKELING